MCNVIWLYYPSQLPVRRFPAKQVVQISQSLLGDKNLSDDKARVVGALDELLFHLEVAGIDEPLLGLVAVGEEYSCLS